MTIQRIIISAVLPAIPNLIKPGILKPYALLADENGVLITDENGLLITVRS